jgi:hypothetical protein
VPARKLASQSSCIVPHAVSPFDGNEELHVGLVVFRSPVEMGGRFLVMTIGLMIMLPGL